MPKDQNSNGNVEVYLENVRLSHPHLWEPQSYKKDKNSKPRFSASFILDKKKQAKLIEQIDDAIEDATLAKWGKKPPRIKEDNICFIDGDDTDKPEYQGKMVLKSASPETKPPTVIDKNREELGPKDRKPYAGCIVNAIVRIYAYDAYDNQINASLEAVQYAGKGEAFGPAPVDTGKFKDLGDDEDDVKPMRRSRGGDGDEEPRSRRGSREDEDAPRSRRASRDEDDAPRGRRASREDDDGGDEPPARRRGRGREDEDEAPAPRRRSASRDEPEDDAPRGRRRPARDDD